MIGNWLIYAAAFEKAIDNKDWTQVIQCFHPQATYIRNSDDERLRTPKVTGNKNIAANFETSVEQFDRRFTSRNIRNVKLACTGDFDLKHHFQIIYKADGLPDFEFSGFEDYVFDEQGLIVSLEESLDPGVGTKLIEFLMQHGAKL
tara:strand:- start:2110 stop:2547 length:438 start_codon:yes stop_codon:yes gene_type:complete